MFVPVTKQLNLSLAKNCDALRQGGLLQIQAWKPEVARVAGVLYID